MADRPEALGFLAPWLTGRSSGLNTKPTPNKYREPVQ